MEVDGMAGEAIPDMVRADEAEARKHEEDQDKHQQLVEEARNQTTGEITDLHSTDMETVKRSAEERVDRVVRAMPKADHTI
jgi:Fe2+ transport system protein B